MIDYKQVPLLRVAARKALEEEKITFHEYKLILMHFDEIEKNSRIPLDLELKSLSGEWLIKKSVVC
jgi:hypothetical protein